MSQSDSNGNPVRRHCNNGGLTPVDFEKQCFMQLLGVLHIGGLPLGWLKPDEQMLEQEQWPAENFRGQPLSRQRTLDELKRHFAPQYE